MESVAVVSTTEIRALQMYVVIDYRTIQITTANKNDHRWHRRSNRGQRCHTVR